MNSIEGIKEIKAKLGDRLFILAHHYQNDEIIALADCVGDSLKLAQMAEKNKTAEYIVFCGVHFMAETADILTEDRQRVFLPNMDAGCPMANMASLADAERAWEILCREFGDDRFVPVTYVNSRAEIKAFCGKHNGTVVTSGNAPKIMKWALEQNKRVLFLPDQNLGRNTAYDLGVKLEEMADYSRDGTIKYACPREDVKIILWDGYCHVHHRIKLETLKNVRRLKPNAKIIAHPECQFELIRECDGKGSTEYLINTVKDSPDGSEWVVGTESNLVMRLVKENPTKKISILDTSSVCFNMNKINSQNLLDTLNEILAGNFERQVTVDKQTAGDAIKALNTMLRCSAVKA